MEALACARLLVSVVEWKKGTRTVKSAQAAEKWASEGPFFLLSWSLHGTGYGNISYMYIVHVLVGAVDLFVRTPLLRTKLTETETKTQESLLTSYSYR